MRRKAQKDKDCPLTGFPGQGTQGSGEGAGESDLGDLRPLTVCLKAVKMVNFIMPF